MASATVEPLGAGGRMSGNPSSRQPRAARATQRNATSLRGLDWLNFFMANVQTGFGPFIAVYLTSQRWTQTDIGIALSVGTVTAMISQIPGGALVDAVPSKRIAAVVATLAIAGSALLFAIQPDKLQVFTAEILHGIASCVMTPAIAAISLALVGRAALGERLGRNASFASIGNGLAAGVMGACGAYVSSRSVFILTAALAIPAMFALRMIGPARVPRVPAREQGGGALRGLATLFTDRRLLAFAACAMLFQLSDAAMLPIAAARATAQAGSAANLLIAACIVVPQIVVAFLSPQIGRWAETRGRRYVLLLGWGALPLRGVLMAIFPNAYVMVGLQALSGISAATFGVMLPLISADVTRGTGRFNLVMGALGLAVNIGATLSTTMAGALADHYGVRIAFLGLAGAGGLGTLLIWLTMPETRRRRRHRQ
ncbi:MFS transporter [Acidisphaera rubrifaciens]|uniref:Major facilitator superfamily transporter n=1 Tax=Acidisphaera rubrifaciens HS-AP3 TaxID=1231350 RepID=A0A0D6PBH2_9PROT|nr:MFS transporter [Acidisphaera rubrifaciens]GAN78204.1 major facilitator superfamily transporter [Acidisphaera rubrifaciens HS-AP3]